MDEKELEKEAAEYAREHRMLSFCAPADVYVSDERELTTAILHFAEPREKRIAELEKENAELKCECRRCVHTDCPCILSDYGKDRNGICDHFKDVFDENAELQARVEKQDSDILFLKHLTEEQRLKIDALDEQTPWKDIKDKSEVIRKYTKSKIVLRKVIDYLGQFCSDYPDCVIEVEEILEEE